MPISSPESIRLGGNEDVRAHPPPFGALASSTANPAASASPHGRPLERSRRRKNVATNRASCNQRGQPRNQLVQWTPQGGSSVLQRPSISRVQAPASETSARQSSEYGLLLRPSFICAGMAVERAAGWATPASFIYAAAAGDEQADLGVARVGFSELQSLEQQQRLPLFCARAQVAWRVAWRVACFGPLNPLGPSGKRE